VPSQEVRHINTNKGSIKNTVVSIFGLVRRPNEYRYNRICFHRYKNLATVS